MIHAKKLMVAKTTVEFPTLNKLEFKVPHPGLAIPLSVKNGCGFQRYNNNKQAINSPIAFLAASVTIFIVL
jgi:hypothetical protein